MGAAIRIEDDGTGVRHLVLCRPDEFNTITPVLRDELDAALDGAERELNFEKRRALFADIQRIHAEDLPVLPMFFRVDPFVIPKPLKGVTPTGHLNSSTLWIEQWRWEN